MGKSKLADMVKYNSWTEANIQRYRRISNSKSLIGIIVYPKIISIKSKKRMISFHKFSVLDCQKWFYLWGEVVLSVQHQLLVCILNCPGISFAFSSAISCLQKDQSCRRRCPQTTWWKCQKNVQSLVKEHKAQELCTWFTKWSNFSHFTDISLRHIFSKFRF